MDEPFITAPFYPPSILVNGILVNREGHRFVAEDSYHSRTSLVHVMQQPDRRPTSSSTASTVSSPATGCSSR